MKNILSIFVLGLSLISCTAEELQPEPAKKAVAEQVKQETNTFTVVWDSNQDGSFIEFRKHVFRNCEIVSTVTEIHTEKRFNITMDNGQTFDIQIKHTEKQKYPELYLSIYKGDNLQFEQEVNSNGYLLVSFVDSNGNIAE